ncbi:MAG: fimbrillin family protein, partial [Candidatus Cryptobacteroides sp.]
DKSLDGSILIDNLMVTTSAAGEIVFSPKIYYPFGNQYAYSFYSYYPYSNTDGEPASIVDGAYSITYELGNTDILWANSVATDYDGVAGYNAAYCRAVKKDGMESTYFPKLQYKHLLTAMVFKVVGKDSDIANYDVKVTGMQITNTSSKAILTVADSQGTGSGVITGNEDGGSIGFTDLDVAPTSTASELCTILAMPATSYTAEITLTVDGANQSTVALNIGSESTSYNAGYIYYFTVTINNPQEVTIIETGLEEWLPGDNPEDGKEI